MTRLTTQACPELGEDDALVFCWHRVAVCCAVAGIMRTDCRRRLGMRRFTSDLPPDFGLRAMFGRARATEEELA